ncbi:MAG: dihydrolipoamide acetyltransferase family protein [Spirochaetia bacterium]|jgi:pyruvate dehydrogenase E2 component (dihydrolipoamide acetyltransferase)
MAVAILMPKLGLTMEVGIVVSWRKKEGETVEKDEAVLEVETDKIVTDVQSPQSGVLLKVFVPEGTEVKVQTVLAVVGAPGEDISAFMTASPADVPAAPLPQARESAPAPSGPEARIEGSRQRITPRARKLLADNGYSPADLEALGKTRITETDVQEFLAARAAGGQSGLVQRAPAVASDASGQVKPMGRIEKIVADRMTQSFRDIPQFSIRFVADMDNLLEGLPALRQSAGAPVTINDLVLRATAIALSRCPDVQYQFRPEGIFVPSAVNLGFAVAMGRDLVVPVIHNAGKKGLGEICREATDLAERAKTRRLAPEDLSGGTFTVSNLGMFGISSFVPIVNPGEGAILGVGAVHAEPRVHGDAVTAGQAIEMTLVCDHRSVNGATAAEFCRTLKQVLELPQGETW